MTIRELKTWPPYFQDVLDGRKRAELRRDDRNFSVGDELVLREYDPRHTERMQGEPPELIGYTGRALRARVTHVLRLEDCPGRDLKYALGYVMLSIGVL